MDYHVHENMSLASLSLKELLSSTKTKEGLTKYLADCLLTDVTGPLVVVQGGQARGSNYMVSEEVAIHTHEEADTLIPLHVIDTLRECTMKTVNVLCSDTDVLLLLMDLVANKMHGAMTKMNFIKLGKSSKNQTINIIERVRAIGSHKVKGFIRIHNFSGSDWGGKFVGITKQKWIKAYMELSDEDNDVIYTFQQLGNISLLVEDFVENKLPAIVAPLEKFVCSVYAPKGCPIRSIPELRWELFRSKNLEGEKLPPTIATLYPHIMRSNYVTKRDKSYTTPHPELPKLTISGWEENVD